MLDTKNLRGMSVPELKTKVEELKQSHSKEYVKAKVGSKSDKAVNLRNIRKDVARVLTIITEKENKALNTTSKTVVKTKEKKEVQKSSFLKKKSPTKVKKEKNVAKKSKK